MHVIQVLSSMAIGGQERVALDLAAGLCRRGHRVTALSFVAGGALAQDFKQAGAAVRALPKGDGVDGRLVLRLLRLFREDRPDVVHSHNPQPLLYAAPAARLCGVPAMVHTKHGANPDRGRRLLLRQAAARLCGAYVAVSAETAAVAAARDRVRPPRLVTIPNGIDLSRFQPDARLRAEVRRELGLPEAAFVIGTVGRLAPEKAQGLLIAAVARLLAQPATRPVYVLVTGDGAEREALQRAAEACGGRARLLGARRDVPRVLQAFDVFCLSSRTEGLPLVIPEAMATGLPVVSTAVGGIPSVVVEGQTGLLVPPGDEGALAQALGRLLHDPALGPRLGQAGRERALQRYSLTRMVDEYEALYRRLLARG